MKIAIVCGGRDYSNAALLFKCLDELRPDVVIHGAARGADTLADQWCESRGVWVVACPAAWKTYRRKAGPIRNTMMLEKGRPQLVIAFDGGNGTADMVSKAMAAGIEVKRGG